MTRSACVAVLALLAMCGCTRTPRERLAVDPAIASELDGISAIDNHAHPEALSEGGQADRDFDALPADAFTDLAFPTPFRPGNPEFRSAWQALFGYTGSDTSHANLQQLQQARTARLREKGELYPVWVLNQAKTETMLANRVAMGRGLSADRFKWVPFVDAFLFPLNNATAKRRDPEHKALFDREEQLLGRWLETARLRRPPANFDDYLTFVSHTLEAWKGQGAVALKFELAYLRDLQISNPERETAERVYAIYAQSSEPAPEEYKLLQDYLFRFISREGGRLGLPIHIHSSIGAGAYFQDSNANAFALESVFNDPALRRTRFVLLHGSWPFTREAAALILKPNVYLDLSGLFYFTYAQGESAVIRQFLEANPEHVLYGSDASPFSESVGWAETAWIGNKTARRTLGIALTEMVDDGEISFDRAKAIAHLVMRENARSLYRF